MGFLYDEIVAQTRVSKGSIVNIVKELKSDVYPDFDDVLDQIDALRTLAVDLKKGKKTITHAILGSTFINRFLDLGIEPKDVNAWIRFCKNIVTQKYPLDQFMRTVVELMRLEEQIGLNSDELLKRYHNLMMQITETEKELGNKNNETQKAQTLLVQLTQTHLSQKKEVEAELQQILNQRNLTLKQINHISKLIPQELMKTGLDHQSVNQVIAGAKLCGGLTQFTGLLEKEKTGLGDDFHELHRISNTLDNRIAQQQYDLYRLKQECNDVIAQKNRVISQMERGMDTIEQHIDKAKDEVATLTENKQTVINEIKVLLTEYRKHKTDLEATAVLFKLLEDPHNIASYDLRELVKMLNWIVRIGQGKAKHLRYHLTQFSENARQRLIAICANLLKDN